MHDINQNFVGLFERLIFMLKQGDLTLSINTKLSRFIEKKTISLLYVMGPLFDALLCHCFRSQVVRHRMHLKSVVL